MPVLFLSNYFHPLKNTHSHPHIQGSKDSTALLPWEPVSFAVRGSVSGRVDQMFYF